MGCHWNRTDGMWLCRLRGSTTYGNPCIKYCDYYIPVENVLSMINEQKYHEFIQSWAKEHPEVGKYLLEDTCEICHKIIPKNTRVCPGCKPTYDKYIAQWTREQPPIKHY